MSRQFLKSKNLIIFLLIFGLISLSIFLSNSKALTKEDYAEKIFQTCKISQDKNSCYQDQFKSLTKDKDLFFSVETVKMLQNLDPQTNYCHNLAHTISIEEVSKNPQKWLELLSKVSIDDCSRGYFHGVFEGYMRVNNNFQISADSINDVCSKISKDKIEPQKGKILRNCPHAMGHLLLVEKNGDVKASIDECQKVSDNFKKYCDIGVFMEDSQRDNLAVHGLSQNFTVDQEYLKKTENLCNEYNNETSSACWQSLGEVMGKYYKDKDKTYISCQNAKNSQDQETCYLYGISALSTYLASNRLENPQNLNFCGPFTNEKDKYQKCITSLISYVLNTSESFKGFLYSFCQTIYTDNKNFCLEKVKNFKQ